MSNYKLVKNTEWKEVEINGEMKEIPKDWDVKKFNEFSSICRGGSPRPIQNFLTDKKDGTPWIKISDATKVTKYIDSTEQYIIKEGESRSRLVYPGDLIVSNSATPGIPRFLNITACIHDGWLLLRDFKEVDKEFLFQLVGLVREKLKSQGSGSIFTNLSIDILSNFECVIPPIQTQSSIASILSEQESIIQDIESLISKYESRFQYLSDELLSGRLRVKEVDGEVVLYKNPEDNWKEVEINGEMKEIPKDWNVEKIENLLESDFAGEYGKDKGTTEHIVKVITLHVFAKSLKHEKALSERGYESKNLKKLLKKEDILIEKSGGSTDFPVGRLFFFEEEGNYGCVNFIHCLRFNKVNKKFVYELLQKMYKDGWTKEISGQTTGISNLKIPSMLDSDLILPSDFEQKLISTILLKQKELIKNQKEFLIKEKNKFNWLLDNLLSGNYLVKEMS